MVLYWAEGKAQYLSCAFPMLVRLWSGVGLCAMLAGFFPGCCTAMLLFELAVQVTIMSASTNLIAVRFKAQHASNMAIQHSRKTLGQCTT